MAQAINYDPLAAGYVRYRRVHPRVRERLLQRGGITSAARVLEVGCGTGNYIVAVQEATGCIAWGLDPSVEMLAWARARSDYVAFLLGVAEALPLKAGACTHLFTVDVIHHLRDRSAFFREAHRVLADGGIICTVTDSADIIRHREPLADCFPETVEVDLRRYPSVPQLMAEMRAAGFAGTAQEVVEYAFETRDISIYRERGLSTLLLLPDDAFRRGLSRLERLAARGPIRVVLRYVMLWGHR